LFSVQKRPRVKYCFFVYPCLPYNGSMVSGCLAGSLRGTSLALTSGSLRRRSQGARIANRQKEPEDDSVCVYGPFCASCQGCCGALCESPKRLRLRLTGGFIARKFHGPALLLLIRIPGVAGARARWVISQRTSNGRMYRFRSTALGIALSLARAPFERRSLGLAFFLSKEGRTGSYCCYECLLLKKASGGLRCNFQSEPQIWCDPYQRLFHKTSQAPPVRYLEVRWGAIALASVFSNGPRGRRVSN